MTENTKSQTLIEPIILTPAMKKYQGWLTDENIKNIEEEKKCKFVGEFPVRQHSTEVGALFWQDTPPDPSFSNYFFLYYRPINPFDLESPMQLYITGGGHVEDQKFLGMITDRGDFIYSRGRHDFLELDGSYVDGGDSYFKTGGTGSIVNFILVKDKIVQVEGEKVLDKSTKV